MATKNFIAQLTFSNIYCFLYCIFWIIHAKNTYCTKYKGQPYELPHYRLDSSNAFWKKTLFYYGSLCMVFKVSPFFFFFFSTIYFYSPLYIYIYIYRYYSPYILRQITNKLKVCLNTTYFTKNCSKTIFKCVNNTMGPIFNIFSE